VLFEILDGLEMTVFVDFEVVSEEVVHGILLPVSDCDIHDNKVGAGVDSGC
jgi:hypothetical protein